jgi:hypothetical protein
MGWTPAGAATPSQCRRWKAGHARNFRVVVWIPSFLLIRSVLVFSFPFYLVYVLYRWISLERTGGQKEEADRGQNFSCFISWQKRADRKGRKQKKPQKFFNLNIRYRYR